MIEVTSACLWFETQAEDAASFYVGLFPQSRIKDVSRYGKDGPMPEGTAIMVSFELAGRAFSALNGGMRFEPNEAVSFVVNCDTQAEIDRIWDGFLAAGGKEQACGWIRDPYGFCWQIVPACLPVLMGGESAAAARAMAAMMQMVRLDITALQAAYDNP